jgi:Ca2+-binding EF-hand superfamily protein
MSRKIVYLSNAALKGKSRGNSRGESPEKRPIEEEYDLSNNEISLIKESFELMDTKGTGVVEKKDLEEILDSIKTDCLIGARMLQDLLESDEPITLDVFIRHLQNSKGDKTTKEGIRKIFGLIDNGEGKVTFDCLKNMCKELSETLTDEDIQDAIDKIAPESKCITIEEFQALLKPKKTR